MCTDAYSRLYAIGWAAGQGHAVEGGHGGINLRLQDLGVGGGIGGFGGQHPAVYSGMPTLLHYQPPHSRPSPHQVHTGGQPGYWQRGFRLAGP